MLLQVLPFLLASSRVCVASYPSYQGGYEVVQPQYHSAPQAQYVVVPQEQYHAAPQQEYYAAPQAQYYVAPEAGHSHYQVVPQEQYAHQHGDKYGEQGYHANAHKDSGYGQQGSHHQGGSRAYSAHGKNNAGAYGDKAVHGAQGHEQGQYRNVGSYSHDKGSGFEKSYSYDTAEGHHEITDDHAAHAGKYGESSKQGHHNIASKAVQEHEKHGAHSKTEGFADSKQGVDKTIFDKYGYSKGGHQKSYSYSPVYGYGYH